MEQERRESGSGFRAGHTPLVTHLAPRKEAKEARRDACRCGRRGPGVKQGLPFR